MSHENTTERNGMKQLAFARTGRESEMWWYPLKWSIERHGVSSYLADEQNRSTRSTRSCQVHVARCLSRALRKMSSPKYSLTSTIP